MKNASIPGYGITGSCPTINSGTFNYTTGMLPAWDGLADMDSVGPGAGDLPAWSSNKFPGLPNDGVVVNSAVGGCILSNGLPFSYFPVGNIFYDAFAARFPMCTPEQAFGPATWALNLDSMVLEDTGSITGVYNINNCLPINLPGGGCCDITGGIAATQKGRNGVRAWPCG